jgi:hypothetical protein
MGERAGYRIKVGEKTSWICRKQWYLGGSESVLARMAKEVAENLLGSDEAKINDGGVALRDDLDMGRMFSALTKVICEDMFESINPDIKCDIGDHGLFEIEMVKWNKWNINHYDTCREKTEKEKWGNKQPDGKYEKGFGGYVWGELQPKAMLGEVGFEKGKTLKDGMKFKWAAGFKEY